MSRAEERRQAWLEAQKEPLNRNGMPQHNPIPVSTRIAEETRRTAATPDPQPAPRAPSAAGCAAIQYVGRVRERLEIDEAKKREEESMSPPQTPEQLASDQAWFEMEMKHRKEAEEDRLRGGGFRWDR